MRPDSLPESPTNIGSQFGQSVRALVRFIPRRRLLTYNPEHGSVSSEGVDAPLGNHPRGGSS